MLDVTLGALFIDAVVVVTTRVCQQSGALLTASAGSCEREFQACFRRRLA